MPVACLGFPVLDDAPSLASTASRIFPFTMPAKSALFLNLCHQMAYTS